MTQLCFGPTREEQLAEARNLFKALTKIPEALLAEFQTALGTLIRSHYVLMQSPSGRNAVSAALVATTMRAQGVTVDESTWDNVAEYQKALSKYLGVRCRFDSGLSTSAAVRLRVLRKHEKDNVKALKESNQWDRRPATAGLTVDQGLIVALSGTGLIYVDDSYATVHDALRVWGDGIELPTSALRAHVSASPECLLDMEIPVMSEEEPSAIAVLDQLLTKTKFPLLADVLATSDEV